jgi:hypothetical protein
MHISSVTNPLSRTEGNVPVAVFVFEDRRKFLRVSEDYIVSSHLFNDALKLTLSPGHS